MSPMLARAGFQLCEFAFDGEEICERCDKVLPEGTAMYYMRTCYEVEEGDYRCRRCAFQHASGRDYDPFPAIRRSRPMHGGGWAYLHRQRNAQLLIWRAHQ